MSKKVVLIPLAEGAEEIEATTIFDVLDRCGIVPLLLAVGSKRDVRLAHGLVITTSHTIGEYITERHGGDLGSFVEHLDAILLPGGMPGATNLSASEEVTAVLKGLKGASKLIGAVCASPAVVLAPLKIVNCNTPATCYPGMKSKFDEAGVAWADLPVVYDRSSKLLTSKGPGTTSGFALAAAAILIGGEAPARVNTAMLTDWAGVIEGVL